MRSSKFLAVGSLCIFYATGLVVANPNSQFGGGNQFCESVRTVTVTKTVAPGQPSPSPQQANKPNSPPPAVTSRPGNVNLGNGGSGVKSSSDLRNTKTSSAVKNTQTDVKGNTNLKDGNGNNNNNNNQNTNTKNTKTSSVVTSSTALPPASTGNSGNDLTLNPSIIQTIDTKGQAPGEADSLASSNNFINFCVGKTITNGKQVKGGSCNPTPIGDIPSVGNMPSAKFNFPKNFDTVAANTAFTIALNVKNMNTGSFTNAANTYFAAPQQLSNGTIVGHNHIVVQQMKSLDATDPLDPKIFAFFKGLNDAAQGGVLTASVTNGLPAGFYRISCITSASNHQEVLGPIAQRGSFNDAVYITVADGGKNNASSAVPPSSSLSSSVSSSVVDSSTSPPNPSSTGRGGKGGKNSSTSSSGLPVSTSAGGKKGGEDSVSSSSEPLISTSSGGKNGGKDSNPSSSEPPVPTSTDRVKGGKGGNVLSTPAPLPESSSTPANGNGKVNTNDPTVSSSTSLPASSPTQGGNGSQGGYGYKRDENRMTKRSRRA